MTPPEGVGPLDVKITSLTDGSAGPKAWQQLGPYALNKRAPGVALDFTAMDKVRLVWPKLLATGA